jgi:alpha-N-arabinofuranosidase
LLLLIYVVVGEYATRDNAHDRPEANTAAAMDDAAFMTGLERNSDIVIMACYAPLFGHLNDLVWTPDGIYYDGLLSFATPAWWVQHLFSVNRGDIYIPTQSDANPQKIFHVASKDSAKNALILKIVNTNTEDILIDSVQLMGIGTIQSGTKTLLTGGRYDVNSLDEPLKISPLTELFNVTTNTFTYNAPAFSLTVFEILL